MGGRSKELMGSEAIEGIARNKHMCKMKRKPNTTM